MAKSIKFKDNRVLHSPYSDEFHAEINAWAAKLYAELPPAVNAGGETVKFVYRAYDHPAKAKSSGARRKTNKRIK